MKLITGALVICAGLALAGTAAADPWVDYTPQKGGWEVTTVKVDPNHVDDYLVGLKNAWVPQMEALKRHGVIDSYSVMVKLNSGAGDNVILLQHYPTLANLEPEKTRDMALMAEGRAQMSKEAGEKLTNGFDKYRSFSSDEIWTGIEYPK